MDKIKKINCFFCSKEFNENLNDSFENLFTIYEQHLLNNHSILIPKFSNVEDFVHFLKHCKSLDQLQSDGRCSSFTFKKFDKILQYFIIDKQQINDTTIKNIIEKHFLESILNDAQKQRNDSSFGRTCLFCRKVFTKNRAQLFNHLYNDHNFFVGHPDNILNSHEFLEVLENKLKNLLCLYCEKQFKSWKVLKEHMRKKGHKTLNPNNREYDKFYLINYLCTDKHWRQIKQENDFYIDNFSDEWCDWIDDDKLDCLCFFCTYKNKFDNTRQHMLEVHNFDFGNIYTINDFYDRIKTVNFIRKCLLNNQCHICQNQYDNSIFLFDHLSSTKHITELPSKEFYQSPEYYFPILDDDCFLLFLDDFDDA